MSREHIVSEAVLKTFYGRNIKNLVSTRKSGQFKRLTNYEDVIRDVCAKCNSLLTEYDNAGKLFAENINDCLKEDKLALDFSKETLNWLIKTHLNNIRQNSEVGNCSIIVNKNIYKSLIEKKLVNKDMYSLVFQTVNIKSNIWKEKKRPSSMYTTTGKINDEIAFSQITFKYINTFLLLPISGTYDSFKENLKNVDLVFALLLGHPYAKTIDTEKVLIAGKLELTKDYPEDMYRQHLINLDDYEEIFIE